MRYTLFTAAACVAITAAATAAPRFDLSSASGRRDARATAWQTWEIGRESTVSTEADGLTVTLTGVGGELEGFLHKAGLAKDMTLASDGVRCEGDAIEIKLEGLSPGEHTLATYHHVPNGKLSEHEIRAGGEPVRVSPGDGEEVDRDTAMATGHVTFKADGKPVILRISSRGGPAVLNALEIDAVDPQRRARGPSPINQDAHADGDDGAVTLTWEQVDGAKEYRVYFASAAEEQQAREKLDDGQQPQTVDRAEYRAEIEPRDSLRYYAWRVDTVDDGGEVSRGDEWTFRVRSLAFPGAEGYGRFARGGRGGRVMKVTTLKDGGPGSLRAAVEADGPRTIVFDVSGRIVLNERLILRNGECTLAGQTAPGMGVCISNYNLGGFGADDLILRYVRVRPGDTSGDTLDGMGLASCDHSIVDHCSISWTQDESFSSRNAKNITLQRTLISEALNIAGHRKYGEGKGHGFAASIGGDIGSFHHNLLAHCAGRNWSLAGGIDQATRHQGVLDIRNNVVYNWEYRTTDGGARLVQFVNNYYKPGPATRVFHVLKPERKWVEAFGPQEYYAKGNIMEGRYADQRNFTGIRPENDEPLESYFSSKPFFPPFVQTQSAKGAYRNVLADVGCNYPELDEHDQRIIRETRQGKTTYVGSKSGLPGLPDSQQDVGGWEDYPEEHRPDDWDTDNDGMPNEWEEEHGLDPSDPSDGAADPDGDGYTNLEDYLNGLVG